MLTFPIHGDSSPQNATITLQSMYIAVLKFFPRFVWVSMLISFSKALILSLSISHPNEDADDETQGLFCPVPPTRSIAHNKDPAVEDDLVSDDILVSLDTCTAQFGRTRFQYSEISYHVSADQRRTHGETNSNSIYCQ
jgi:hypothetical protein